MDVYSEHIVAFKSQQLRSERRKTASHLYSEYELAMMSFLFILNPCMELWKKSLLDEGKNECSLLREVQHDGIKALKSTLEWNAEAKALLKRCSLFVGTNVSWAQSCTSHNRANWAEGKIAKLQFTLWLELSSISFICKKKNLYTFTKFSKIH